MNIRASEKGCLQTTSSTKLDNSHASFISTFIMGHGLRERHILIATFAFGFSVLVLLHSRYRFHQTIPDYASKSNAGAALNAVQDGEIIESLNLNTSRIEYRRYCFTAIQKSDKKRQPLIGMDWPLLSANAGEEIETDQFGSNVVNKASLPGCQQGQVLYVPLDDSKPRKHTGKLILGTATFLKRINQSLSEMSRWLANTDTELLVILRDKTPNVDDMQTVMKLAEDLKMSITLISDTSMTGEAQSNFGLAIHLQKALSDETQWVGVIDDDTFFPSLPRLLQTLAAYDPSLPWYIGGLTERRLGISREGFKAWGGAGVFFSRPLLTTLAENHQLCLPMAKKWGDALWRDCVLKVTSPTVHLTRLAGLNQLDMYGNMAGWYESNPNTLSIHHWKSWHRFPVPLAHLVTDVAGINTFLQRYHYSDNVVFTNGYSIVYYPDGLPDMNLVEGTMHPYPGAKMPGAGGEFKDSLGRLRPVFKEGVQKMSWTFVTAVKANNGCVRQFYVKGASAGQTDADSVIEIDWCRG
jgi:hypothetical protein